MKNCCGNPGCGRPFGLIRWSWHLEQFCSVQCRKSFRRQWERNKTYWKWLYKYPDSSRTVDQKIIQCCSPRTLDT